MAEVNVYEAKTQLSRLLNRAEAGEDIVITRHGRPVARLAPVSQERPQRTLGRLRGRIHLSADFDEPLPEGVFDSFEAGP